MKNIILIMGICATLVSCGPSKEEMDARQKVIDDSIATYNATVQPAIDSIEQIAKNIEYRKKKGYYLASDFNLVPGVVVNWSPSDDDVIADALDNNKPIKIYIHIRQENGAIKVIECDERTWHNIHTNDILQ